MLDSTKEEHDCLYIGSNSGLEAAFCEEQRIPFEPIMTGKLRRYFSFQNVLDIFKVLIGILQSIVKISAFKPDVIFSKGGYVAVPVVIAAGFLKTKVVIHESDYTPGLATKISSRIAKKICVPVKETVDFLPKDVRHKGVVTGNPVRREVLMGKKSQALKILGIPSAKKPVMLVMGGSTGAQNLNQLIWSNLESLLKKYVVIHVTGVGKGSKENLSENTSGYFEFEYLNEELPHMYTLADFIVCRSGAGTVSEVNALGLPAIYLPLSSGASRGDQWENATHVSTTPSVVLDESSLTNEDFTKRISQFVASNKKKSKQNKTLNAAEKIAKVILSV